MGIKIGVVGAGSFAQCFIPLFKAHPLVDEVYLSDHNADKLKTNAQQHEIKHTFPSLDEICESDCDAVAIITQHWLHGPQAVQALEAGKHVYSAVPSTYTLDEITRLVQTVEQTQRIYMVGETSYYYPVAVYCRERFRKGDFGHVVYSEGEYYHDWDHGMYAVARWRHGKDWRQQGKGGDPPMFYPTHSTSFHMSVTGAHATHVSCHGFADTNPADRDIYHAGPPWDNLFSNETALLTMSDGSCARINEFRRIGHPGTVRMTMYGTQGSFEYNSAGGMWLTKNHQDTQRLDEMLSCRRLPADATHKSGEGTDLDSLYELHQDMAKVHDVARLPKEFRGLPNGHHGSHQFLVDDFVQSCAHNTLPPNNVWQAARYLIPGFIAHESAKQGGKLLEVPDFGDPPAQWP